VKRLVFLAVLATLSLAAGANGAPSTKLETIVVDNGEIQCANAGYTSIAQAVAEAPSGSLVRVCPGVYNESVVIDKPLTLKGQPEAVEAVDCFDPALSQPTDLDPTQQVILDGGGPASGKLALIAVDADDVVVAGFVFQGAANALPLPADDHLFRRAVDVSGAHSGDRIHHNLFRLNTVGIQLGSNGATETRFDHNCLRQNRWGLAADYRDLKNARIDHNKTYDTINFAFELFRLNYARENLSFDHNSSRQDRGASYYISGTTDSSVVANTIESSRIGMRIEAGNDGLEIAANTIGNPFGTNGSGFGVQQGIAFVAPATALVAPTAHATVRANTITGMGTAPTTTTGDGIVAAGPPNAAFPGVVNSSFVENVTSDNRHDGIILRGLNAGNTLSGNVSERNGRYGILVQGALRNIFAGNAANANGLDGISLQRATRADVAYDATDNYFERNTADGNGQNGIFADAFSVRNTFVANAMHGNAAIFAGFDARDDARGSNTWSANVCDTDSPPGTICGIG